MNILIIGAGKVGTALAGALNRVDGYQVDVYENAAKKINPPGDFPSIHYDAFQAPLIQQADLFVIAVPDDAIPQAVHTLQNFDLQNKHVLHTSGFRTSAELSKLQAKGAHCASWHPLQTFHNRFLPADVWRGIVCTFEGAAETRSVMADICGKLDCRQMEVSAGQKKALHLAATISANYSAALLAMAEQILEQSGLTHEKISTLLSPLMERVIENFRRAPAKKILSGPAQRGDIHTLTGHLNLLQNMAGEAEQHLYLSFVRWITNNFDTNNTQKLRQFLAENPSDNSPLPEDGDHE